MTVAHHPAQVKRAAQSKRKRYELRHGLWRVTQSRTLGSCGRGTRRDAAIEVHAVDDGQGGKRGTVKGLQACASVWGCPVCAAHIRQARAVDIEDAATRWMADGGQVLFLTLTVRHGRETPLAWSLDVLLNAWRATTRGAPWKRKRDAVGLVGQVRATEVTWGQANGWHPHLHLLLFLDRPLSEDGVADLTGWLESRWARMVRKRSPRCTPSKRRGVTLKIVSEGSASMGEYLAKVQDRFGTDRNIGLEMARGDLKSSGPARRNRWLPFELLEAAADGEAWALRAWWEYEAATKRRRAIEWSRCGKSCTCGGGSFRAHVLDGDEVADEELVTEDTTTEDTHVLTLTEAEWRAVCAARADIDVVEAAPHGPEAVRRVVDRAQRGSPPG